MDVLTDGGATGLLAATVAGMRYDDLAPEVVDRVRSVVLDFLGVALLGAQRPHALVMLELEQQLAGGAAGTAGVVGHPWRTSLDRAAGLNGTFGSSAPNLDDVWHGSLGHPGVGTHPGALALGEATHADGRRLVEAVVAGYETTMRVGRAIGRSAFERGWHPRGGCNALSAAVAALRASGVVDPEVHQAAIGHAANAAAGLVGAAYFHDAWYELSGHASRVGVRAAAAAERGLGVAPDTLEAPRGYIAAVSDEPDLTALTDGLGERWLVLQAGQKLYPSSGATHAALEAAIAAADELELHWSQVASVRILGFREMVGVLGVPHPDTLLAATMSTPFVVACGLRDRTFDLHHLRSDVRADPALHVLQDRITLAVDARLDALPPAHLGARVEITADDGRSATSEVLSASGHPGNPLGFDAVAAKIRRLLADEPRGIDVDRLVELTRALPDVDDVGVLLDAARPAA